MLVCTLFSCAVVHAQETMQAKKYEHPEWKRVLLIKFKPDKASRGMEIISDYYLKACTKSGTPAPSTLFNVITGDWDLIAAWDMKEGIEEMNWETSPDDIAWLKALNEIAGGETKAKAILDEFSSLIDRQITYIGRGVK